MTRTRAEIIKSMGMDPHMMRDFPQRSIDRMAIKHAGHNVGIYRSDFEHKVCLTDAQLESAVNCLLDCEERLKDIISGDDN
jgi:hypothetical protein